MNAQDYWSMFLETGAPELYLMYHQAKRMEKTYVSEDSGLGSENFRLQ